MQLLASPVAGTYLSPWGGAAVIWNKSHPSRQQRNACARFSLLIQRQCRGGIVAVQDAVDESLHLTYWAIVFKRLKLGE